LAPTLDTHGWGLVGQGEFERVLKFIHFAQARAGARPDISYHLVLALDGVGRRDAALKHLRIVANSSTEFVGRASARELLAGWQQ
jgi:hypothetical protein